MGLFALLLDPLEPRAHLSSRTARDPIAIVRTVPQRVSYAAKSVVEAAGFTFLGDATTPDGRRRITDTAGLIDASLLKPGTYKADGKPTEWRNVRFSASFIVSDPGDTFVNCFIPSAKIKAAGVTIAHCELSNPTAGNAIVSTDAIGLRVLNCRVHDYSSDAFRPGDGEFYVGNYVYGLGRGENSHADAWQTYAADGNPSVGVTIASNVVDLRTSYGDGVTHRVNSITLFSTPAIDWTLQGNYFRNDGRFAIESSEEDRVSVIGNVFATTATNGRDVFYVWRDNKDAAGRTVLK